MGVLFTEDGALKLARLTKAHIGELLAIVIDGRVTMVPRIDAAITGGEALIHNNFTFTEEEAESIARGLSSDQTGRSRPIL